jgi:hypothetical protein
MENPQESHWYRANGIILHAGTATAGHYTAYIRIGEKWFSFSDTSVSEILEPTVFTDAYGGYQSARDDFGEHIPSAYMVFYEPKNSVSVSEPVIDSERDGVLLERIATENRNFLRMQSVFGTAMMKAMLNNNDPMVLIPYFFNVFAHSQHVAFAERFSSHFLEVVLKDDRVGRLFAAEAEHIKSIFLQCTCETILHECILIVNTVLEKISIADSLLIAESLFDNIAAVVQNWRVLPQYLGAIISFCKSNIEIAVERQWISQLVNFVQTALSTKSSIFVQNIDLSSVFDFLSNHLELTTPDDQRTLTGVGHIVVQGQSHIRAYLDLIRRYAAADRVNISDFINGVLATIKDFSPSFISSFFAQVATNEDIALKFLSAPRVSKEALLLSFTNEHHTDIVNEQIRERLFECPMLLFRSITWDAPKVISRAELVIVLLFRQVTSLLKYPRAEAPLVQVNFSQSRDSTWKDAKTVTLPLGSIFEHMTRLGYVFMDRTKEICENPERFLSGPIANRRLTHLLRVCIWIVVRTGLQLSEQQMTNVLDLFEAIRKMDLENDANIIELVRLTGRVVSHDLLIPRFASVIEIVFTRRSDDCPALRSWLFSTFFESFVSPFETNLQLCHDVLRSPHFQTVFAAVTTKYAGKPFKHFAKVITATNADVSALIFQHFDTLITEHTPWTIQILAAYPNISLDDAQYTLIASNVIRRSANDSSPATIAETLRFSLEFVEHLVPDHTLLSTDAITACMCELIGVLSSKSVIDAGQALTSLLTELAKRSPPIKESVIQNIAVVLSDPDSFSWFLVRLQLSLLDTASERASAASSAVGNFLNAQKGLIDTYALLAFGDLIVTDGLDPHVHWALPLFTALCRAVGLSSARGRLHTIIARHCQPSDIISALSGAADALASNSRRVLELLERLRVLIPARPELRTAMIAAAGLAGNFDELRPDYATNFPEVFV